MLLPLCRYKQQLAVGLSSEIECGASRSSHNSEATNCEGVRVRRGKHPLTSGSQGDELAGFLTSPLPLWVRTQKVPCGARRSSNNWEARCHDG